MAKGLLFVAFTACMLASAQPFIVGLDNILAPVTGVVNGMVNSVAVSVGAGANVSAGLNGSLGAMTNIVGGLTGTVSNLTSSLSGTVNNLFNPVLQIVNSLTGTAGGLTNSLNIGGLADTVGKTLQTAVSVPLNVVTGLAGSITGSLNVGKLAGDITGVLKPTLDALTSVTNQLNGTEAVGCLLNSGTGLIKGATLTSVGEILTCATPVTNVVKDLTKDVTNVTSNGINFASQILSNATNCLQQSVTSVNIGLIVPCVVDPVTQTAKLATNTLSDATPMVSKTFSSALQVPTCVTNVLTKTLNKTTDALQSIVQCAAGKGVSVTLPNLPSVVPNFTSIANTAVFDLEELLKNALGSKSPINKLFTTVDKLKEVTTTLIPNAVNSVNTTLNSIQEVINTAAKSANGNTAALICVSTAQKSLNDLAPLAVKSVVDCATNVANNTASLVAQAAAIDISLKTELISVAANGFIKCNKFTGAMDNSVDICFKSILAEVKAYIKSQFDKINTAITTAQSLIDAAQKCLSSGVNNANLASNLILDQIKTCLARQGVTTTTEDITSVVSSGKAAVEKVAADLTPQVNLVSTTSATVQGSFDFIVNIDKSTIEGVIFGSASGAINAALEVELALKNNTNPAVMACIASTKDKLGKLEGTAVVVAVDCVNSIKQKATSLAAQVAAEEKLLKEKLANAGVKAQAQCSASATKAIAEKCFVDAQVNLKADTVQTIDRVQTIFGNMQMAVSDAISCVNESSSKVGKSANEELDSLSKCLAVQGINVTFSFS